MKSFVNTFTNIDLFSLFFKFQSTNSQKSLASWKLNSRMILELTLITVSSILGHNTSKDLVRFKEDKLFDKASGFFSQRTRSPWWANLSRLLSTVLRRKESNLTPRIPWRPRNPSSREPRPTLAFLVSQSSLFLKNAYTLLKNTDCTFMYKYKK